MREKKGERRDSAVRNGRIRIKVNKMWEKKGRKRRMENNGKTKNLEVEKVEDTEKEERVERVWETREGDGREERKKYEKKRVEKRRGKERREKR